MADSDHELTPEPTPAFAEARQRRLQLHDALVRLEKTISSPARGRADAWTNDVVRALTALQAAFDEHIEATERPGGLYEEILDNSARLAGQVRRLKEEHPTIRASIASKREHLSVPVGEDSLDDARDDLQRVMGLVVRHRQRGADLVWEAYNLDIGGAE